MMQKWGNAVLLLLTVLTLNVFSSADTLARSSDPLAGIFQEQPKFLPVEDAFIFDAKQEGDEVELNWTIADEYYLYADKFQFAIENADLVSTSQGDATQIEDEFFGIVDVYFFEAIIKAKVANVQDNAVLKVRYQGCAKAGLCYQPVSKSFPLSKFDSSGPASGEEAFAALVSSETQTSSTSNQSKTEGSASLQHELLESLKSQNLIGVLAVFFALGVGLAFTPCVFPMFPILSGIIAGQKNMSARKGLYLAFIYVQGMALTYSLLGLVVASAGAQFQAALQHPAILVAVSIIFIALAGAMFGWYTLQLPQSWTSKLTEVSNKQKSGNVVGVFMMGLLSGLIASPCTTAPLTGALLYVAQTGDMLTGFLTLYVLSLGMGLPLLLIGVSGGKLLPKAGGWMNVVKNVFGFILLTIPLILLERFIELQYVLMLAGGLLFLFAAYMHSQYLQTSSANIKSGFWLAAWLSLAGGLFLFVKPMMPAPTHIVSGTAESHGEVEFVRVVTVEDIQQQVAIARAEGKTVMLDLYADWCVACKEFEAFTFSDSRVQSEMAKMLLLQVDMTENSDEDLEIMEQFQILGLPTILFFNDSGVEQERQRVTGFMGADEFLEHLTGL